MLCVVGIGICGRLGACGVFQSEQAVDVMVCAMHCVWGVSIRRSCGCDSLCHASRVWGVSIRTSCGCDGLCRALRMWGVLIRRTCGCDGLCHA